ncbi:MAG: glycosyltransferase family 4 protein [Pseudomonadota bacterium]
MKNRTAIVVQRCHSDVVGGSEALAWSYAQLLAPHVPVEVLTTSTTDAVTWENNLPPGTTAAQGVTLKRYPVTVGRSDYWHNMHRQLLSILEQGPLAPDSLTIGLQHEFVRHQGPHSEKLLADLERNWDRYHRVLFITYLYSPTFFGSLQQPDLGKAWLVPTLHDEPVAQLPVWRDAYRRFGSRLIWLTDAERKVGRRLWDSAAGHVVGMPVAKPQVPARAPEQPPYFFYCGRIDEHKGCKRLVKWFADYRRRHGGAAELRLAGTLAMAEPSQAGVKYLGRLTTEALQQQLAGATGFILPSRWESFSIALLEAMSLSVPCLVDGACEVTVDHLTQGSAGFAYRSQQEFDEGITALLELPATARAASQGAQYVARNYAPDVVADRLQTILALA